MAILGAIGALAGAGIAAYSANSQAQNARRNNAAQEDNYLFQRRMAMRNNEVATAPTRDARGNVIEYIEGVGWVERPTDRTRALIAASDNEEARRLREDAPRSRMRRQNTFQRQLREGLDADAQMARASLTERSPEQVRAAMLRAGVAQAAAAPNAVRNAVNMNALRQGSGGETAIAELGRANMADRRSVIASADANSPAAFDDAENSRLTGPMQRYGMLAGRATAGDDVPFAPTSLADTMMASRGRQQSVAPQAMAQSANLRAPTFSAVDDRLGLRIGSGSAALEGFFDSPAVRNLFSNMTRRRAEQWDLPAGQYGPPSSYANRSF